MSIHGQSTRQAPHGVQFVQLSVQCSKHHSAKRFILEQTLITEHIIAHLQVDS
jgi:hypothetical protein